VLLDVVPPATGAAPDTGWPPLLHPEQARTNASMHPMIRPTASRLIMPFRFRIVTLPIRQAITN
jgi:hypothetical protein